MHFTMNYKNLNFLIFLVYLISSSSSYSIERPDVKNLIIHNEKKKIDNVDFFNSTNKKISLSNYQSKVVIINFWATWCAPCREEMPSLDILQSNKKINSLVILPINVGKENLDKAKKFFEDLKIKNLKIYYESSIKLANNFSLIGLPTTILINKNGEEFARILGSIDFEDEDFIEWLSNYN